MFFVLSKFNDFASFWLLNQIVIVLFFFQLSFCESLNLIVCSVMAFQMFLGNR